MKLSVFFAGLLAASALHAAPVYNNTTNDLLDSVFYSTGAYSEIGDQIHLGSTERLGSSATVQFFNAGSSGSFDATLNLYRLVAGNPGVSTLFGTFLSSNITIGASVSGNVSFSLGGLTLPDDMFFTVGVSGISGGADLGLNLFDAPTVGTSNNQYFITKAGSFARGSTGGSIDNIYFRLDANAAGGGTVPEPGTSSIVVLAMVTMFGIRRRRVVG